MENYIIAAGSVVAAEVLWYSVKEILKKRLDHQIYIKPERPLNLCNMIKNKNSHACDQ